MDLGLSAGNISCQQEGALTLTFPPSKQRSTENTNLMVFRGPAQLIPHSPKQNKTLRYYHHKQFRA